MGKYPLPHWSRWLRLTGYCVLVAATQLLWLTYAPVTTESASVLHTSVANIGNLAVVFPLLYVILAIPAGRLLDLRFRLALVLGAALTGAGALVRLAAPFAFPVQLAGQVIIAVGQPFVLNAITKLAEQYFPPAERPTAVAIGSASLFVGILAAMVVCGPIWRAGGLLFLLIVEAIPAVAGAVWVAVSLAAGGGGNGPTPAPAAVRFRPDRLVWQLSGLLSIGMGLFNALSTWLEPILSRFNEASASGNVLAEMALAGIIGSALFPAHLATARRSRAFLIAALIVTIAALAAIAFYHSTLWLYIWMGIDGLGLLSALPVLLNWVERHVDADGQAQAVGLLMLAGNLGGVALVLADEMVTNDPYRALGVTALAAAAVGSGATDDYAAHLYVGTSSWITCHVPFKKTDILHNMAWFLKHAQTHANRYKRVSHPLTGRTAVSQDSTAELRTPVRIPGDSPGRLAAWPKGASTARKGVLPTAWVG